MSTGGPTQPRAGTLSIGLPTKRDVVPEIEERTEGQAARRTGDRVSSSPPPPPSRAERDRQATAEVMREVIPTSLPLEEALAGREPDVLPPKPHLAPAMPPVTEPPEPLEPAETTAKAASEWGELRPDSTGGSSPPPTRLAVHHDRDGLGHRPVAVVPIPEVPETGLWASARYTLAFARARWQRRSAITKLRGMIVGDTGGLDSVLGKLGASARALEIRIPVLGAENDAIDSAEKRRERADHDCAELSARQAEENAKFGDIETERQGKVNEAEAALDQAQNEHSSLEAQRRGLRDKRKAVEKRQKGFIKAAEDREGEAAKAAMGEQREALRTTAKNLRRDAAALDPERQDIERRIQALDKPISQALAKLEALKGELESARRSLNDAREGHRLRQAELEAEQGRKSRELGQAEAEIQRRLITLGTLVNLNRIERPEFREIYDDIDRLRGAIGARSNEIDRLTAEREAYDKGAIVRGSVTLAGAGLLLITIIIVVAAAL